MLKFAESEGILQDYKALRRRDGEREGNVLRVRENILRVLGGVRK